ncbi:MAG: prepilin-type N-terminal cleavage/methylation domain-containing protein [Pseudomonadota bacterium]
MSQKHISVTSKCLGHRAAFTLVELSIVLVVIGLIVGGILMGKTLIQQAEIRAAASQLQKMETSYNAFRLKYNCIVGDCANATDFFGIDYVVASGSCTLPNGRGNGNNNGLIDNGGAAGWFCESMQGAKSLELSNLLPTSIVTPCWSNSSIFKGVNDGCAYFYNDDLNGSVTLIKQNTISWFTIAGGGYTGPTLSPVQARLIDEKIDNGTPTTGKFRGLDAANKSSGTSTIVVNSCVTSGVYNLNEDYTCRALYYFK